MLRVERTWFFWQKRGGPAKVNILAQDLVLCHALFWTGSGFHFIFLFLLVRLLLQSKILFKGPELADEWLDYSVTNLSSTWAWIWPMAGKVDFFPKSLQNDPSTKSKELLPAQMTLKTKTCCPSTVTSLIMITDDMVKYLPLLNNYNLMLLWTVSRESSLTCESWAANSAGANLDQVIACMLPLHLTL